MIAYRRLWIAAVALVISASLSAAEFKVGDRFPEMHFPSLSDGALRSAADFQGKKLVLHVFASW